ncbi:MAG: hypothetical protein QF890_03240 [Myxococcota bacterium]|nr:hypothetical protein [bacterium]MDP6242075.1 hypothetical protein [Myxococcota bacterium]MDP7076176.1 hypothetical protein [Myxococcota bacterium]MDP7300442.1 hypothetical protein [Myxococcota bacterium]MDP7431569.1 hypothetical protein [Myxococcota bacterium]
MSRSSGKPRRRNRKAGSDPELAKLDPYDTRVPDGEYPVVFVFEERFRLYRRDVWAVEFRIIEGEHAGLPIFFFLNVPPFKKRRTPSAKMSAAYEAATGRRAPARIAKVRPGSFLAEKPLVGRTRTVERNSYRESRPPDARYSVIDRLLPQRMPQTKGGGRA